MHQLIIIATEAESAHDACGIARSQFEGRHASLNPPFDYGKLMNNGGRWSQAMSETVQEQGAVPAASEEGQELIQEQWDVQTREFNRNLAIIKKALESDEFTDEDIQNDVRVDDVSVEKWNPLGLAQDEDDLAKTATGMTRHTLYNLGRYSGPGIYLYDEYGTGIRTPARYEQLQEDIEAGTVHGQWWTVPVDVHY